NPEDAVTISSRSCRTMGVRTRPRVAFAASPPFGVRSLLNLLESGISVADPVARLVDLSRIHWNRARNFFPSRHECALVLHRLRTSDREFPMMPKPVERVKHGLGFNRTHAAATHCVVEHPVAILPWALVFPVSDIVQYRSVPVFPFKRSTHDRPEVAW